MCLLLPSSKSSVLGLLAFNYVGDFYSSKTNVTGLMLFMCNIFHLVAANYKAVRCLSLTTLNNERSSIVLMHYMETGQGEVQDLSSLFFYKQLGFFFTLNSVTEVIIISWHMWLKILPYT